MIVLGISRSHEGGACIIKDGEVLSAISEERLNRIKSCWGFPYLSIPEAMRIANIKSSQIDIVAMSNYSTAGEKDGRTPDERKKVDYINKTSQLPKRALYTLSNFPLIVGSQLFTKSVLVVGTLQSFPKRKETRNYLDSIGIKAKIKYVDHHLAHASSAFLTSGYKECLAYTSDFMGDFSACKAFKCNTRGMKKLIDVPFYHSIGMPYAWITCLLGFTPGKHEGKVTGLAAYGDPAKTYHIFAKFMKLSKDGLSYERNLKGWWFKSALIQLKKELDGFSREDISAGLQRRFEDVIVAHIKNIRKKIYASENIALAGGLFSNVRLNQRILEIEGIKNIFIQPAMSDGGLALGAALYVWANQNWKRGKKVTPKRIDNVFWGPEYSDEEIEKELKKEGLKYKKSKNIAKDIANLLTKNRIVARFDGRMEFGPRALGSRSILYPPTDVTINDWLNKLLKRTEFMPFAPLTLEEDANKCYNIIAGGEHAAKFMTITFDCKKDFAKKCPAVVHVDNTARPQLISKKDNPIYYDILKEYKKKTGLLSIINTSFNMHEEPIVCTPHDAIRSFKEGHLDYLAIGNFIVKNTAKR